MRLFTLRYALLVSFLILVQCAESSAQWYPAVVDQMAGRYGAFMEGYRYRKLGHLALISDGVDVYSITMGDNRFLGRPNLPSAYNYEESFNWVGVKRSYGFKSKDGEDKWLRIYESLLAPGFLYDTNQQVFRWCWEERRKTQGYVIPLKSGVEYRQAGALAGERYAAAVDGFLGENWIIVTLLAGKEYQFDCPLLFIFERQPVEIEVVTHEFFDFRFDGPAGKIVVMPLYGVRKIPFETTLAWRDSIPEDLIAECSFWYERLQHYPVSCREEYRFDDGDLTIRNTFEYVSFKNASAAPLAPVPPFVRLAQLSGYPLKIEGDVVSTGYPTNYGPLDYVTGDKFVYTIPACPYVDKTVAPVRITGLQGIGKIKQALASYLASPDKTWAGDHDYRPDDVMDTMHNLRLLAWTTWSLPEDAREKAMDDLRNPGLDKFIEDEDVYIVYRDPVAGVEYARDSTVFAQRGKVSYDADWYNGFTIAGLWAYGFYGDRDEALRIARSKWGLLTLLRNYMEIYHDWALCCNVVDPRGNLTDWDCMRNGWLGLLAYARLAKDLGRMDQYRQTRYLASKEMVSLYVNWTAPDFFYDLEAICPPREGKKVLRHTREDITGISTIDGYLGPNYVLPDSKAPYNLSAAIPEHNLFLTDFNLLERAARLTYDLMPRFYPDLNEVVTETFSRRHSPALWGDWGYENRLGGLYFYFLDPHLCLRAMNFHEPLDKLLSYLTLENLSGPQIEAFLAGSRPMLVVPTDVEFFGNVWNEKDSSLTFTLGASGAPKQAEVEIRNCPEIRKIFPEVPYDYYPQARKALLRLNISGKTKTKVSF